ncbi:MAG: hypothetical protein PHU71_06465 [Candidatus Gracilibacteria bacterium]|nr:hypothetical protein [Candidatus Gracilibacteria bacterium]
MFKFITYWQELIVDKDVVQISFTRGPLGTIRGQQYDFAGLVIDP